MRQRSPLRVRVLLAAYIGITLLYQLVAGVSLVIGFFDLRHQVKEAFGLETYSAKAVHPSKAAVAAGLAEGDRIEKINGVPVTGRAVAQAARWWAKPGESVRLDVMKPDGRRLQLNVPLEGYSSPPKIGESIFVMFLQIVIPIFCLVLGYWVAMSRPEDLNAWLILVLLSFPAGYISVSTFNWLPGGWLVLRLAWHLILQLLAPAALLWFGLLFPQQSRLDRWFPWLKWLVLAILGVALAAGLFSDYCAWYDLNLYSPRAIDSIVDPVASWTMLFCLLVYWAAIFDTLRTTSSPDGRRRMKVLCVGSVIGLGSTLFIWGLLPRFGVNPGSLPWLGYTSALLLLIFPLSLAYVVVVQRAMDVRLLVRAGTRYLLARASLVLFPILLYMFVIYRFVVPVLQRHPQYMIPVFLPVFMLAVLLGFIFRKRTLVHRLRERLDKRFFREAYDTEKVLSDLAVELRPILDPAMLAETIASRLGEVLHIRCLAVLLRDGEVFRVQRVVGVEAADFVSLTEGSTPVRHLVRTSAPALLYREAPEDWFLDADAAERLTLDNLNAEVLLPLTGRNKLMGVMVLGPKQSEEPYSQTDLRLLTAVAVQAGMGLEINDLAKSLAREESLHQRMQREVEIAREVQERLFPQRIPQLPGIDLSGHCRPALGVGGDYYDMIELEDGRLALAIGDVSGKGIAAALLMASLRASLRGLVDGGSADLGRMIGKLNRLVYEASTSNRYATFFFGIFDPGSREFRYVNGGHNAPLIVRNGDALRLEATGPVVGLLREMEFEEASVQLDPGDMFIGYTDGISEAMTVDDEEWGEENMLAAVLSREGASAAIALDAIFREADKFTCGAPQYDDMTVLICRV